MRSRTNRSDSKPDLHRGLTARSRLRTQHRLSDHSNGIYRRHPILFDREIRLLSIDGSEDFEAPLQCSMTVVSLDDTGTDYQTLSYAWESQQRTRTIWVNDQPVHITESLFSALRRIRQKQSSPTPALKPMQYLWADAVCIDQDNDDEKSQQVALMGEIYASARRLIIWLGEASEAEVAELKAALRTNDTIEERRTVLESLLGRTWFSRRWTVQEIFQSPRRMRHVLVGSHRFFLEELATLLDAVATNGQAGQDFVKFVPTVAPLIGIWLRGNMTYPLNLMTLSDKAGWHFEFSLFHLLVRLSRMQCSDPRDIIYSLVGLAVDNKHLRASYDARFEDVLHHVALRYARGDGRGSCSGRKGSTASPLKSVLLCATVWSPRERRALPSWVPDWSQPAHFTSDEQRAGILRTTDDFGCVHDDDSPRDIAPRDLAGGIEIERGCAASAVPLEIDGFLLRECGHDFEAGEGRCTVCDQLTRIWWLRLPDDMTIFELEGREPGGSNCFKLKDYGGYLDDKWVLKRPEASSSGSMTREFLLEGQSAVGRDTITVSQGARTNVRIR